MSDHRPAEDRHLRPAPGRGNDGEPLGATAFRRGALTSASSAMLWAALALTHPRITYHLAPLLVVAAWPTVLRFAGGQARPRGLRLEAVAGGICLALTATVVLVVSHSLRGPTLIGSSGALGETLLGVGLGTAVGVLVSTGPRPKP